jgi:hypothetical protein
MAGEKVRLDISGVIYTATRDTLSGSEVLSNIVSLKFQNPNDGIYFINRDGHRFRYILDYLRDNSLSLPEDHNERKLVIKEFFFYMIFSSIQELMLELSPFLKSAKNRWEEILRALDCDSGIVAPTIDSHVGLIKISDNMDSFRSAGMLKNLKLLFETAYSSELCPGILEIRSTEQFQLRFNVATRYMLWSGTDQLGRSQGFDWGNVVVAGGSVLSSLLKHHAIVKSAEGIVAF